MISLCILCLGKYVCIFKIHLLNVQIRSDRGREERTRKEKTRRKKRNKAFVNERKRDWRRGGQWEKKK